MTTAAQPSPEILDIAGGVQPVMGDRGLYQRMLRRFCGDYVQGAVARAAREFDFESALVALKAG